MYPVLFVVPAVVYLICARPAFDRRALWVYITGVLMTASLGLPLAGMSSVIYLIIWMVVAGALLAVSSVVWIVCAVRKKRELVAAPILTGVTALCTGVLIGNWVAAIAASLFLLMVLRYRLNLSFD